MRIAAFLVPFALGLPLAAGAALAADPAPHPPLDFTVLRNGEAVGTHTLRFQPVPDNGLQVSVDTNVVVKMAMIPVYRFEHHGRETWKGGHLVALTSETNDDGTHHVLKVDGVGDDGLSVAGDGKTARLPETLPASLWNDETIRQSALLNTLDGHAMAVRVADLGGDRVAIGKGVVAAHHYAMTDDLSRELWYDATGTLVQVRFKAKDDSDIQYVLR